MKHYIHDLIEVSRRYGRDPDYIIAGGGNTSFKNDERIWVKASGTSMADIDEDGFVCLDRSKLKTLSQKTYSSDSTTREQQVKKDLSNAILYPIDKRPSVETSMHEVIDLSYVVHTHPTLVCGLLCAKDSRQVVTDLFGEECLYIEYTDPGYVLFKAVDNALRMYRSEKNKTPSIIFLENHGVFVAAESVNEIDAIYSDISKKIAGLVEIKPDDSGFREDQTLMQAMRLLKGHKISENLFSIPLSNGVTDRFVHNAEAFLKVSVPFTPDNIVYCKSKYLFISEVNSIVDETQNFQEKNGYLPKIIAIEGAGIIALEDSEKAARIALEVFEDMMKVSVIAENFGGPRPMTPTQIEFIDNWEVENYRRQVSKS